MSDTVTSMAPEHRYSIGPGRHRIDASRNLWTSNLNLQKLDSVNTDVAWGHGSEYQVFKPPSLRYVLLCRCPKSIEWNGKPISTG